MYNEFIKLKGIKYNHQRGLLRYSPISPRPIHTHTPHIHIEREREREVQTVRVEKV